MKVSKKKIIIISIVTLIVISPYVYFKSLDVYEFTNVPGITSKDGVVYHLNSELTKSFKEWEVKSDKAIGRVKGEGFFNILFDGPRIYKLRDYEEKEAVALVYYFDDDYIYIRKNNGSSISWYKVQSPFMVFQL